MQMQDVKIVYYDEDEGWLATCSNYPDCTGFGDTKALAREELTAAVQAVIERKLNEEA